jgi:rhomboid domain-containing protein 1
MFRSRRRRSPGIGILLLAAQLMQTGVHYIPPVTLGVIALNTAIYLRLFTGLPSIRQACISYAYVWYGQEWKRIIFSPFFHLDDMHLYYNMVSFLWKGMSLEPSLGTSGMLGLLSVFSVLTSVTLLILDLCLSLLLNDPSYLHTCAAGFSGVIFALKVVTTYNLPPGSMTNVFLFRVPSRIAYWAELVVIQLLLPSVSFTGHLAGILVGLLYVKGPLKHLMKSLGM